jgi:hypothetical protein
VNASLTASPLGVGQRARPAAPGHMLRPASDQRLIRHAGRRTNPRGGVNGEAGRQAVGARGGLV